MRAQAELSAQDVQTTVQNIAQEHLPLAADGYICTREMIYDVLMKAAMDGISIDAICRDLENSAIGNTLREIRNEQLSVGSYASTRKRSIVRSAFVCQRRLRSTASRQPLMSMMNRWRNADE